MTHPYFINRLIVVQLKDAKECKVVQLKMLSLGSADLPTAVSRAAD